MIFITLSALLILWVKNPLHAVLGLILIFINSALMLLSLNVSFIALIYVVIYVGAICVLFLFVIMLLHLRRFEIQKVRYELIPFFLSFLSALTVLIYVKDEEIISDNLISNTILEKIFYMDVTNIITAYLFKNVMTFTLLTLLLLLAIISPIILAAKSKISTKNTNIFNSLTQSN